MASPAFLPHPIRLSPLEQLMPRAYVRQIYCFPPSNSSAISTLSQGLAGLARDVPYILSRVISTTSETGSTVSISAPCHNPEAIFSVHDLSDSIDYAALKAGNFPPGAFLAAGIVPPDTLPPYPASPAVFLARASLVRGGLLLCVAVHHVVLDITGFAALLKIWASHCRDGSSRDIGFDASWMDRGPLFSSSLESLPSPAALPKLLHIRTPGESTRPAGRSQAGQAAPGITPKKNYQTSIFYFPQAHLRALKDAADAHLESSWAPGSWVSTSDILSALLWSAVLEAEDSNGPVTDNTTQTSTLSFPVQFRPALNPPLPRDFLGTAFLMTNAKALHRDVCCIARPGTIPEPAIRGQESKQASQTEAERAVNAVDISALAKTALAIRNSVRGIDDAAVREVLAYLEAHAEVNPEASLILGPPRADEGGSGMSVVSWAKQGVYELNWGDAIGRCDSVRLAKMGYERDPIVLPRVPALNGDSGGLEVIISYEERVMRRLMEGTIMRQFAILRCLS
ncbi:hypothetical protein F4859DRAFT_503342 [Xylaria cf. heliscus]|nr:hypothetical protein F4859DRAFT_503342 [Xylaria cf. heliscus]